jgi:predicted RNase H-like nuclease
VTLAISRDMIILFNESPHYPNRSVGVYRIATVLRRHGVEVEVIDFMSAWEKNGENSLFELLDTFENVEWWGFSGKFPLSDGSKTKIPGNSAEILGAYYLFTSKEFEERLIDYIRSRNGTIVVGGPNAYPLRKVLPEKFADILCDGYADNGVIAIHDHIVDAAELKYTDEYGFKVVDCNKDYGDIDLNNIDVEYSETDFLEEDDIFPIEITRGCIFQCAFCTHTHTGKKAGTYIRSKESIKKDIVDRYTKYKTTQFMFVDDTFNDSIEKMEMIAEIRQETGIPFEFWSYGRLDLLRSQPRMVDLIGETGWSSITFGVETFNRSSGKAIGKGADPEKLKEFLLHLRERYPDLLIRVNIIIGLPDDTEESANETVQWFLDNPKVCSKISVKQLAIFAKEGRRIVGKIGENLDKYGYKEIQTNNQATKTINSLSQTISWINKQSMTQDDAIKIARNLRKKIKEVISMRPTITLYRDEKMSIGEDGNRVLSEKDRQTIIRYVWRKRNSRGL